MAAEWQDRPVPPVLLPGEGTCQRISSHPSVFLIFFLPVCTSELVYLRGVTFHQRTGCGLTLVLFLHLPPPSCLPPSPGPHTSSSLSNYNRSIAFRLHFIIYPHFSSCFFSFTTQQSSVYLIFSISPFALCSVYSLPTFLSYASPWSRARRAASAYRTRSQPASESQPAHVRLSVPGAATEAGPYRPPSSAHLLYLSAGTMPSTHTVLLHLPREPGRRERKKITQA